MGLVLWLHGWMVLGMTQTCKESDRGKFEVVARDGRARMGSSYCPWCS